MPSYRSIHQSDPIRYALGGSHHSGFMLINSRYQVLHPLQEGGFGHTFLAEDTQLPSRRRCVLKQLKPVHDNPEFYRLIQDRFQREAAIQETLGEVCPQIPRLYAYFPEGDLFYLVEEWIDGDTLRQRIAQTGPLSEPEVRAVLMDLLATIEVVHQHQIIHRDIKPDNIILRRRDNRPVLIDFGAVKESMATIVNSQGETGRSIVIGTTGYMAPEQSTGRPLFSSDLYSLGLTAIFLLTGRSPVELNTDPHTGYIEWRSQAPQTSEALVQIIQTAIHINPSGRFATAQHMRQALQMSDPAHAPTLVSTPQPAAPAVTQQRPAAMPQSPIPPSPIPQAPIPQPLGGQPMAAQAQYGQPTPQYGQPTPQYGQPSANPAPPSNIPTGYGTQVVSPAASHSSGPQIEDSTAKPWGKAVMIGAGLGGALLVGFVLAKSLNPSYVVDPSPVASSSASTSPSPTTSVSPSSPKPEPSTISSASPTTEPSTPPSAEPVKASTTCGDPPGSDGKWYPVFIDNADLAQVRRDYCQDAIAKKRDNGTPTIQVASFTDQARAETFAQEVGGDVGQPYQVGNATTPSPASSPAASVPPSAAPPAAPANTTEKDSETNAVIVDNDGATNVRRGPGTKYGVQHVAYSGDRVKILDSDRDAGGYMWYKVYFPKSGASGWIAGQLLKLE